METSEPAEFRRWPVSIKGTPVFLYHGIFNYAKPECSARERKYWISETQFSLHLASIRRAPFEVVSLTELTDASDRYQPQKQRVVITFDDGRASDYQIAFSLLSAAQMTAEFFINPASVGTEGFLTWTQVIEMRRAGMSFQSHGYEHIDLARLSSREIENQLTISKWILEDKLGGSIDSLSVPYGHLSAEVVRVALRTGYKRICNSRNWPARPASLVVNRVALYSGTTADKFERLLTGNPVAYSLRGARAALLFFPKVAISHLTRPQKSVVLLETFV
jgi:peptidoglycan/xylan/chitin deacetylase (PgdA/CDA1 family)